MDVAVEGRKQTAPDEVRAARSGEGGQAREVDPRARDEPKCACPRTATAPGSGRKVCEVTITGHGHTLRAKAAADAVPVAVDKVVDKLEHQVERLKGKLVGRSQPRRSHTLPKE